MKHKLNHDAPVFTTIGYFSRWYEIRPNYANDKLAYEALEIELQESFKIEMYRDYAAFRKAKSRFTRSTYAKSTKKPHYV